MDLQRDFVTISLFGNTIRSFSLNVGEWYQFKRVSANNYNDWTGICLRKESSAKTLDELGLDIPDVMEPSSENASIVGKIIHFDNLVDYNICSNTKTRL